MWKRWKKMKKRNNILDQITFRAFRKKDFPEILKLWQLCGMGGEERGDTAETILKCNSHGGYFVVLECTSQKIIIGTSWMTWDGRRIYLHHFCIHPEYRGKGFGKLLGHECLRFIAKKGAQVKLEVHKNNQIAKKIYEKLGFFAFTDYDIYMIREVKKISP